MSVGSANSTRIFPCAQCGTFNRLPSSRLGDKPKCGHCKTRVDTTGKPITLTDKVFSRFVSTSPVPVLVDVWAPWCGPCRMIGPVVEQIGQENAGRLIVAKLNSDENPEMATALQIRSIPTILIYQGGEVADRITGAIPKAELTRRLAPHLR